MPRGDGDLGTRAAPGLGRHPRLPGRTHPRRRSSRSSRPRSPTGSSPAGRHYRVTEVVLVHDCGPDASDDTVRALAAAHDWVRPVWLSRNFGQHAATLAGIAASGGEWVVTMDEDGQHDPEAIGALLDTAMTEQADVVYARPTNEPPHGALRNLASRGREVARRPARQGRRRQRLLQLPAGARRGRPLGRGLRRPGHLPRRRDLLGRQPHRHLPGRDARRGRPALRLHPPPADQPLLAARALQRHPPAALGQRARRRGRAARPGGGPRARPRAGQRAAGRCPAGPRR